MAEEQPTRPNRKRVRAGRADMPILPPNPIEDIIGSRFSQ
jgi:hypothetical protein